MLARCLVENGQHFVGLIAQCLHQEHFIELSYAGGTEKKEATLIYYKKRELSLFDLMLVSIFTGLALLSSYRSVHLNACCIRNYTNVVASSIAKKIHVIRLSVHCEQCGTFLSVCEHQ